MSSSLQTLSPNPDDAKADWRELGYVISTTLFLAFCLLNLLNMLFLDAPSVKDSATNFSGAVTVFESKLGMEDPGFPVKRMKDSQAWRELQGRQTTFEEKWTQTSRIRSLLLPILTVLAAIPMAIFSHLRKRTA